MSSNKSGRRSQPDLKRGRGYRTPYPTILIVCEGKNTEPSYFKQFRLSTISVEPVGVGCVTVSLVEKAVELAAEGNYDHVWCVFDKDSFQDFNDAIALAGRKGFKVAYSNQAFEYWIILHLKDHQGSGMSRGDYNREINKLLKPFGLYYDGKGSKKITPEIFKVLSAIDPQIGKSRTQLAIERARRIYENSHGHPNHADPASEESSTTVFMLVEQLLKYK